MRVFVPEADSFVRMLQDPLKELNTNSERLTSIHESTFVIPGRAPSREPGIQSIAKCLDSGSAPKRAHPGMTSF
jgi:hypothetical protein